MSGEQEPSASGEESSIAELTERIQDQSVKDQPGGILESSTKAAGRNSEKKSKKSGKQAENSDLKSLKQAQQASDKPAKKVQPKKKIEGAALIGIDVAKDADFPEWYQQVLTKGDFLDYYDVSGVSLVSAIMKVLY